VKESAGDPWIVAEPQVSALPNHQLGVLGLELMDVISFGDAQTSRLI